MDIYISNYGLKRYPIMASFVCTSFDFEVWARNSTEIFLVGEDRYHIYMPTGFGGRIRACADLLGDIGHPMIWAKDLYATYLMDDHHIRPCFFQLFREELEKIPKAYDSSYTRYYEERLLTDVFLKFQELSLCEGCRDPYDSGKWERVPPKSGWPERFWGGGFCSQRCFRKYYMRPLERAERERKKWREGADRLKEIRKWLREETKA